MPDSCPYLCFENLWGKTRNGYSVKKLRGKQRPGLQWHLPFPNPTQSPFPSGPWKPPGSSGTWQGNKPPIKELEQHCTLDLLDQGSENYSPQSKSSPHPQGAPCVWKILLKTASVFVYVLSVTALLPQQSWAAMTVTESKIFTLRCFIEEVCQPLFSTCTE